MPSQEAYVSLVTNDHYAMGAMALGRSLRDTMTQRKLSLLITNDVSYPMRDNLSTLWDELTVVEELDSEDTERLALLTRPELGVTFSKLHAWRLTQYDKCVFLDADTLVLENLDELFDREELSAAPDIGWPDCFNSGVFVFEPLLETFTNLLEMAGQTGSFDGGDQGLLNLYWSDWATRDIKYHLPFVYNMVPNAAYGYAPAFQRFGRNAKIIHFIGPVKPWQHQYVPGVDAVVLSPGTYSSQHGAYDFIKRWWQVYNRTQKPAPRPGVATPSPPSPLPSSSSSCPSLTYYHSCPLYHHLTTSFIKSTFVQPVFPPPLPPRSHYHIIMAPPCTPVQSREASPAYGSVDSTENEDTNIADSVLNPRPVSPSPSPSPSPLPPSNFQTEGSDGVVQHRDLVGGPQCPPWKSQEQFDIEQGRIDYTGKHRFSFVQEALDRHLEDESQLGN